MDAQNVSESHNDTQLSDLVKEDDMHNDCKPEYNSDILTSGAECGIELCSQPPSHSLPDSNISDRSGTSTTVFTTVQHSSHQNGGECHQENMQPLSSAISTNCNKLDTSQTLINEDDSKEHSDLTSLNELPVLKQTVVESVVPESLSECNDAPPIIEKMDSSTDYSYDKQNPDSDRDFNQQMSSCGDSSLPLPAECLQADEEKDMLIGCTNHNIENKIDDCIVLNVKEEPFDSEYERPDLIYRSGIIVVNSDDDTSSTMFSKVSTDRSDDDNDVSDEEVVERLNARKIIMLKNRSRTDGEVFPEELPPIEYLTISPGEDVTVQPIGIVSGIVGVLVIVKANINSPALYDDTVLFLQDRQPLGLIFEIFGTVEQPFYSVRFNTNKDIKDKCITVGDEVFFAPNADNLTKYVFIAELKKIKCDDASWENDNEPPPSHVQFSDDEEERRARQRLQNKNRGADEETVVSTRRKKRKKRQNSDFGKDPHGPQLLRGDLNRNPFGNKDHMFSSSMKSHRPNSESHRPNSESHRPNSESHRPNSESHRQMGNGHSFPSHRPHFPPQSANLPPTPFGAFRKPWPPHTGFGERPGWNCQSGLLGNMPDTSMAGSQNLRGLGNNNTLGSHQFRPFPRFSSMPFPSPHSAPGHSSGPPQNSFSGRPFHSRSNHINMSAPPPSQAQTPHSSCFPMFGPSHPPPFVNAVFNLPPPPRGPTLQ